jgi:phospholipase C
MPGADPGEGFLKTNYQLFSTDDPAGDAVPDNSGFVQSFKAAIAYDQSKHYKDSLPGTEASQIMGMYHPDMLPILTGLAKAYAVCDHWFASAPTETMPNRSFAAAATSQGHLDDTVHSFTCPSIFGRLTAKNLDWAIYGYNRDPLTRLDYNDTKEADESHFGHFRDFEARCQAGSLPPYTFLEPDFSASGNSQHPNYDVSLGEKLIHDVYYALRRGPGWKNTLLIVSYDEHGGNYDHVPPPATATPPDHSVGDYGFTFTRFGVRVPAVLVSPLIAPGSVFRAAHGVIDHTSVLKTIEERWDVPALTARDKAAPSLGAALTLAAARTDDPLAGVQIPVSGGPHPNSSQPSYLENLHAAKVAQLALRNDKGSYDRQPAPSFASSADAGNYIATRTAAWTQHLQRRNSRR